MNLDDIKNKITLADCMDIMAQMPDKFVDLALVDPEYGIDAGNMTMGSGKHVFQKGKNWDKKPPSKKYFDELFRISKNQIIWGGNYFTEFLPVSKHWIVWDKKKPNLSFAEGELAWVFSGNNLRIFQHYAAMVDKGGKIHPTQKPLALGRWCLQKYAKKGDLIFDSHSGSGTFAIAAYLEGFDFIACEKDADYHRDSVKRFEEIKMQGRLFEP